MPKFVSYCKNFSTESVIFIHIYSSFFEIAKARNGIPVFSKIRKHNIDAILFRDL